MQGKPYAMTSGWIELLISISFWWRTLRQPAQLEAAVGAQLKPPLATLQASATAEDKKAADDDDDNDSDNEEEFQSAILVFHYGEKYL